MSKNNTKDYKKERKYMNEDTNVNMGISTKSSRRNS